MKYLSLFVACAAFGLALPISAQTNTPAAKEGKLFADPVVARGKGFEIKQSEVEEAFIDYKANMASRGQTIPETQRPNVESNLLQRLIVTRILVSRGTDEDKKKAEESVEKLMEDARKQFPTEEAFKQQLKATGLTFEQFRNRALEQTIAELVIGRELKSTIEIKDEAAQKFFDENPERFQRPETVRAAHILFSTVDKNTQQPLTAPKKKAQEELARKVKTRADKGEDFAKLAQEFSEDPGSKEKGGEYVFGRGEMVPEFEAAAFSLKTNQVSDLVETRFGYHIIKLHQKIPPEKLEFAKVLPDLKEGLARQEMQKLLPEYFEKVKKEANVELVGPGKQETSAK